MRVGGLLLASMACVFAQAPNEQQHYQETVRPGLVRNCTPCHDAAGTKGPARFLKATTLVEMLANPGLWRNVAAQMRNRSMPPRDSKLSEEDRLHFSAWIDARLRETACSGGDFAGAAVTRRLNRREYHSTIRDLFGIDFELTSLLPADGTGGAGFDTNGETLYIPPVLLERYMEAAQQILDRAIITPPLQPSFPGATANLPVYLDGAYDVIATYEGTQPAVKLSLKIDGADAGTMTTMRRRNAAAKTDQARLQITLARGNHTISLTAQEGVRIDSITVQQKSEPVSGERRASHYRLLGMESGERPINPRQAARQVLEDFVPRAFRRPATAEEIDKFLKLYDRAADRNDPYEERIKLALKGVLVWPAFLFRVEKRHVEAGIHALGSYELATRLSYFLWSSMPDETLLRLAGQGRLQDPAVLTAQVDRMLDHPRSRAFVNSFTGQWLGTQDIGGRVMPLLTEIQDYYTPDIAADLKAQPVLLLSRILTENRSILDVLSADYTYLTARLAKFYQVEGKVPLPADGEFKLVQWPDSNRAGILGMAGVLAVTSRYKETSPVLRGAWVLETLMGTPVPPPPPEVPALKTDEEIGRKLRMREKLAQHRADAACAACHRLMDPIGLGLENFDWMGRWRDVEIDGKPVDASGQLPTGETFNGPVELRKALLARKSEFVENLAGRFLGYALGRSLQDGDSCTIQRIVQALEKDNFKARTLIREIVLSVPFRSTQGGVVASEPLFTKRPINISGLNATKQDAASHNNAVDLKKVAPPATKK